MNNITQLHTSIETLRVIGKCIAAGLDEESINSDEVLLLINIIVDKQKKVADSLEFQ